MFNLPSNRPPIRIHPYFWVSSLMIGWMSTNDLFLSLICMGVIFISILVHELGHAVTAMAFGQTTEIELVAFGGLMRPSGPQLKPWQNFLVTLNGPLAGFLFYFLLVQIYEQAPSLPGLVNFAIEQAIFINWWWSLFNLFPIYPMDGGQLIKICLESLFGTKGAKFALVLGMVCGGLMGAFFFLIGRWIGGSMLIMSAIESYQAFLQIRDYSHFDHKEWLQRLFKEASNDFENGHYERAYHKFVNVRETAKKGMLFNSSTQYLAQFLAYQHKHIEAIELLKPIESKLDAEALCLYQYLYFRIEDFENAAKQGLRAYKAAPSSDVALLNALSYGHLNNAKAAVGWLKCAEREGGINLKEVLDNKAFDSVREQSIFQSSFVLALE